MGNRITGTAN